MASMVEREILEDASIYSKELESNRDEEDRSEGGNYTKRWDKHHRTAF